MHTFHRVFTLLLAVLFLGQFGCRSVRYTIGDALSPDWLKSQASKDKYHVYTNNAQNYMELAGQAKRAGNYTKAMRNYRQAELQTKKALDFNSYSFKAHLVAGYALWNQETRPKCLEAVEYLEIADDLRAGEWRVHHGLARSHQLLASRDDELIDRLERKKLEASKGSRLELEALILDIRRRRQESLERALEEAHLIFKYAPDQHQAHLILGTTYAKLHIYDKAIPRLETYIEMARSTRKAYSKMERAGVLPRGISGEKSQLETLLQGNLQQDAEAKDLLATIHKNQGDYLTALKYLDAIYEVNPKAPAKYLPPRAFVKDKLGDHAGAVKDMDLFLKKLGAADHGYDEVVRRAQADREKYASRAPVIPRTSGLEPGPIK